MKDMHSKIKIVHAITPQAVGTSGSGGGKTSAYIDRRGYESVEFVFSSGTTGTTGDTMTCVITESDATDSGFTSVADADLIGTEAARALSAAKSWSIGYRGNKRYLKAQIYGTGTATAVVAGVAILGNPSMAPVAT